MARNANMGRCVKLGYWSDEELEYMASYYEHQAIARTANHLDRPYASVRAQGNRLGLIAGGFNRDYINGELKALLLRIAA